jgi:hypothetical protein
VAQDGGDIVHRGFKGGDRFLSADEQGDDPVREDDDVAQRQDWKQTCHAGLYGRRSAAAQQNRRKRSPEIARFWRLTPKSNSMPLDERQIH